MGAEGPTYHRRRPTAPAAGRWPEIPCCPICGALTQRVDGRARRCTECAREISVVVYRSDPEGCPAWRAGA